MKKTSTEIYLEKFTKIKSRDGKLIPFKLKPVQKDLIDIIDENKNVIFLKARQLRITTGVVGYLYHKAITKQNTITALIGYNYESILEILNKVKTFYKTTPEKSQPKIHYSSKYEIFFPETNSKIFFFSASDVLHISEHTIIDNVFATEVAHWDNVEEKIKKLKDVTSNYGKFIIESSPRILDTEDSKYFHKMWTDKNEFVKKLYDWTWGYTEKEIEIIKSKMRNDKFSQEYEGCFLKEEKQIKTPKIKLFDYNYVKVNDVFAFPLSYSILKADGKCDEKLILSLTKHNCLKKMRKNLRDNFEKDKIRKYRILLDNGNWIEGFKIGNNKLN